MLVLIKTFFEQWCGFFAKPIADECVGKQLVFANPFASRLDAYNHFEIVQYIVRVLEQQLRHEAAYAKIFMGTMYYR